MGNIIKMKLQIFSGLCALAQGYSDQGYFWSNGSPSTYWGGRFGNGMSGWSRNFWNKNSMPWNQISFHWQQRDNNDWNNHWMSNSWNNHWMANNWMTNGHDHFWCNEWDHDCHDFHNFHNNYMYNGNNFNWNRNWMNGNRWSADSWNGYGYGYGNDWTYPRQSYYNHYSLDW